MPLDQTALYVETGEAARVVDVLGPVFAQQCEAVRRPGAELRFAALQGWTVALGADALEGLDILAEGLSRELHVRAAAVVLRGAAFRWRVTAFQRGSPVAASGFQPPSATEAMPLYPDAELDAYRALRALGVPAALALLAPEALGERNHAVQQQTLRWERGALSGHSRELRLAAHPDADPPVCLLPAAPAAPAAPGVHFEPRAVVGRAGPEALRRLLALEDAYRARAFAAALQSLDLRFVYRRADETTLDPAAELHRLERGSGDSLLARLLRRDTRS